MYWWGNGNFYSNRKCLNQNIHYRLTHNVHISSDAMTGDLGVEIISDALEGKRVLYLVTGGIAAVDSVRVSRELRRHGAEINCMMTSDAKKIISELALSWGSKAEVISDWNHEMSQLNQYDILLVAPATRNTIAKHINGIIDSPLMMALSAAKGNNTPILFVPSMHDDLFNDSVTKSLIEKIQDEYSRVLIEESIEGRRKQPSAKNIVSETSNFLNSFRMNRRKIVVTLGATKQNIDSVRSIINYSSGKTGWDLSEYLHMMGHDVICLVGNTTVSPSFTLKDVRIKEKPDEMLSLAINIAKYEKPDVWIHSAAVLDYVPKPIDGKKPSGEKTWNIQLVESKKHIEELIPYTKDAIRIGFKLETDASEIKLIEKSRNILDKYSLTAVVANLIYETNKDKGKRCRLIFPDGRIKEIDTNFLMAVAIERIISNFSE